MKIRFLKTIAVDVEPTSAEAPIYSRSFNRWDEIRVEAVYSTGGFATLRLYNGEFLHNVPIDAFEQLKEENKSVCF